MQLQNVLTLYPPSDMTKPYVSIIHHGVHIQDKDSREKIGNLLTKWSKTNSVKEFVNENKKFLEDTVVDFIPFLWKGCVFLLVYRDVNGDLKYCTGYDDIFTPITIHPGIGPSLRFTQRVSKEKTNEIDGKPLRYLHVEKAVNPAHVKRHAVDLMNQYF